MPPLIPLADVDANRVEALLDRAFGADRHAKTAYRVREGLAPITGLSFAALAADGSLAGTIQCWPVALSTDRGPRVPMVMVGPIAVEPRLQSGGLGQSMTRAVLELADGAADPRLRAQMLIGDPEYYARFFGFSASATARWRLPGPVESHRLLGRGVVPDQPGRIVADGGVPA